MINIILKKCIPRWYKGTSFVYLESFVVMMDMIKGMCNFQSFHSVEYKDVPLKFKITLLF